MPSSQFCITILKTSSGNSFCGRVTLFVCHGRDVITQQLHILTFKEMKFSLLIFSLLPANRNTPTEAQICSWPGTFIKIVSAYCAVVWE